jgi:hypothetical protein
LIIDIVNRVELPQRLPATFSSGASVHCERVADPQRAPAGRAVGDLKDFELRLYAIIINVLKLSIKYAVHLESTSTLGTLA